MNSTDLTAILRTAVSQCKGTLAIAVVAAAASSLVVTATLLTTMILVAGGRQHLALGVAGALIAAGYGLNVVSGNASRRVQRQVLRTGEEAVWSRLLHHPVHFFAARSTRELLGYAGGLSMVRRLLGPASVDALVASVSVVVTCAVLVLVDPWLALEAVAITTILTVAASMLFARQQRHDAVVMGSVESAQAVLYPAMTGRDEMAAYAATDFVHQQWQQVFRTQKSADRAGLRYAGAATALVSCTPVIFLASLSASVLLTSSGYLGLATTAIVALQLGTAVTRLLPVIPAAFALGLAGRRLAPILSDIHDTEPRPAAALTSPDSEMTLSAVSFSFPGANQPIIDQASATVPAGSLTAIIGPSGAGKSTLLQLLLGLTRPDTGIIRLGGRDLIAIGDEELRRRMGYVPQTGVLLRGTLRDAVRGFRTGITDSAIRTALERAGMGDVLTDLPMGLDSRISDGSTGFSGGQEQRILLARALVDEPSVLVLDEATSALDLDTETLVSRSVAQLPMTRIVVAHRLSTVTGADQILLLRNGTLRPVTTRDPAVLAALIDGHHTQPLEGALL